MIAPVSLLSTLSVWTAVLTMLAAATPPRISEIGSFGGFTINHQPQQIVDADGDGDLDLVGVPSLSGGATPMPLNGAGHGLLIENLGGRSFAKPRVVYLPASGAFGNGNVTGDFQPQPGLEVMASVSEQHLGVSQSSLHIYPLASPGLVTTPVRMNTPGYLSLPTRSADLDGDGVSELLYWESGALTNKKMAVMDRLPDGTYGFPTPSTYLPAAVPANDFRTCDGDGDGDLDVVFSRANSTAPKTTLIIFERTGHREFAPAREVETNLDDLPDFADLNGDGLADAYRFANSVLTWCPNQGGFSFGPVSSRSFSEAADIRVFLKKISPSAVGAVLTIIREQTDSYGNNMASNLRKVRFGSWMVESDVPAPLPPGAMSAVLGVEDLDLDGHDDLLWGYMQEPTDILPNTQRFAVCWGGDTGFSAAVGINPPSGLLNFALVRDWDRDGDADIIAGPDVDGSCHLLVNDGSGNFAVQVDRPELRPPSGSPSNARIENALAGDVDGDGLDDVVVSYFAAFGIGTKRFTLLARGKGDGSFLPPALPPGGFDFHLPETEKPSQLIDFDSDGDLDVINQSTWTENKGAYFDPEWHPLFEGALGEDLLGNPVVLNMPHAGDLDGDGHPEFINTFYYESPKWAEGGIGTPVLNPLNSLLVAYNDDHGGLETADEVRMVYTAPDLFGNPLLGKVSVADVNADGLPDLCSREFAGFDLLGNPLTSNYWRRNPGGTSRSPHAWLKLSLGIGAFPDSPAPLLDFNGDGRKEWVSPTGYLRPTPAGPVVSSGYDFDGETRIVENLTYMGAADFDGDGDADFLLYNKNQPALFLMRNLMVDERSPIVRSLVTLGVAGGQAGPDNDADGDGRSNFTELLEGTNPLLPDAANPRRFSLTLASGEVSFNRRADAANLGITYRIEVSGDLVTWTPLDAGGTAQQLDPAWERVIVPLSANGPAKRFFRLAAVPEPK